MPAPVTTIDVLQRYLVGVLERADHHADAVNEVILSLAGAIVWRKDQDNIEVLEREGDMKNVLWLRINGQRYAFSYNHESGHIEMRTGSTQGQLVAEFSNGMSAAEVKNVFVGLQP